MRKAACLVSLGLALTGCVKGAIVSSDLPVKRVVVYRNGVAYFERAGKASDPEVRFKMRESEVGDFLATLAVMEQGGSSVRSAAFPIKLDDDVEERKPRAKMTAAERRGLKDVVLHLDGKEHDLRIGYVAESPVWRPSYRLVVGNAGQAQLQAWGIVENVSGEDWRDVHLTLVAGAPLAFESQLGQPTIPPRPLVTDEGEVIASVPKSETSLRQEKKGDVAADRDKAPEPVEAEEDEAEAEAFGGLADGKVASRAAQKKPSPKKREAPKATAASPPPPPAPAERRPVASPSIAPSAPRDVRTLAAVAQEGGTTRYALPVLVTVPDRSATMVMLLAEKVPGEASFLYAPDGGVPASASHPFRVVRFKNATRGVLEKGPIAVFEGGSFLGQGMLDPLPAGAMTTVPFALERGIAVEQERRYEELGERVGKIENGELWIERDAVTRTTYRVRSGIDTAARVLIKHGRLGGSRLHEPPPGTEDNTGTQSALVPADVKPRATSELVVDERSAMRRHEDWFTLLAEAAIVAYRKDPRADRAAIAKLDAVWNIRGQIVAQNDARRRITAEEANLRAQSEETRRNLRAIEKNKAADALRRKLTQRLSDMSQRLDELTKQSVEIDTKLTELGILFRDGIRDVKVERPMTMP